MGDSTLIDCGKKVIEKCNEYCTETDDSGQKCMSKAKLKEMVQDEFGSMMKNPANAEAVAQLTKVVDDVKESKITPSTLCPFYGKVLILMSKAPQASASGDAVLPSCGKKIISKFNDYCTETDDQGQKCMPKAKLQELVQKEFGDMIKNPRHPDTVKLLLSKVDDIKAPKITFADACPLYIAVLIELTKS
ncbi:hypothetical protein NDU88_005638 [Pleurodeles waltl]|uniref:Uncharacterized protein n=1 Tax=Pleurodeles waltl TaxID=8319 RepID=A0AAV7TB16_PLEWA|nr:hypothetical protein NDU88_005638 [Pleurodeles waltl]